MPQVDLETLVCGGGDRKVVCETLIGGGGGPRMSDPPPSNDPDLPVESFRLPIEYEIDWVDRNAAAFYDRDDSTKGTTNPKSSHHSNPNLNPKLHASNSQIYSTKPKAPIIGLPNKLQHSGYLGRSDRKTGRHCANGRIFPKKGGPSGKSSEPTSPKVSCMGRVLSDRERGRRRRARRAVSTDSSGDVAAGERTGFWAVFFGIFSCCRAIRVEEQEPASSRNIPSGKEAKLPSSAAAAVPGLGGMKRFVSGRRSASWGVDVDLDEAEGNVDVSGPLQPREGIWGRRSVGSLEDLDCHRDWENAGPASL